MPRVARYNYLLKVIEEYKCKSILEIGTCRCESALSMIEKAKINGEVIYYGFDLFETITEELYQREKSKLPISFKEAVSKLKVLGENVFLFMGNSRVAVPYAIQKHLIKSIDLIFIDGGHSYNTVKTDWENIQPIIGKKTVVIFDDYMPDKEFGIGPAKVVDEIDREKFTVDFPKEAVDECSRMVKVRRRC